MKAETALSCGDDFTILSGFDTGVLFGRGNYVRQDFGTRHWDYIIWFIFVVVFMFWCSVIIYMHFTNQEIMLLLI